jgi:hypothetical protein
MSVRQRRWFLDIKTYKSTALIAARGEMNIPKEFNTVMKVPGALTNRQGLIK